MKNLIAAFFCLLVLTACDTAKRDRLSADTLVVSIDPTTTQAVVKGNRLTLKAVCRTPASENPDVVPEWSSDNNLGTFSPSTGKNTVFTAGNTLGNGKIYSSVGGVRSSIGVFVVDSTSTVGNTTTIYGLYSETYISPTYDMLKFDMSNPPVPGGGCMGKWDNVSGNNNTTISDATLPGEFTEGAHGLKCSIGLLGAGGWWIQFGSDNIPGFLGDIQVPTDMSAFSNGSFKFDVRTTRDVEVKIEWFGGGAKSYHTATDLGVPNDNAWHSVTIPFASSGINFATITVPAGFHSSATAIYYIDNVRWEK